MRNRAVAIVAAIAGSDFGVDRDNLLRGRSQQLFGIVGPVEASSTLSVTAAQATADPTSLATFAKSLDARVVMSGVAAPVLDMLALWPNAQHPEWLIACNEEGVSEPGLQRINIATGEAATILTGTAVCDPATRTPWGTIVFGEENGGGASGGRVYELIDPINTTGVTLNRATGVFSGGTGASNFAVRSALGRTSFEGLAIYANGLVYYGDENRPASGNAGGAYFKFVPSTLRDPSAGPISILSQSPLASGSVYGLRLGKRSPTDNGQGTNTGLGTWIPISAGADPDLRAQTAALKLTGYYRPEDLDKDFGAEAGDVRFCGSNNGNEATDHNWGEAICISDGTLAAAGANTATPEVQFLVIGSSDLAMPDNIAFQPRRGN